MTVLPIVSRSSSITPPYPSNGQLWHDSSSNTVKIFMNGAWSSSWLKASDFDPSLTGRAVALEIQQRLIDQYDIDSELSLDIQERPTIIFPIGYHRCFAIVDSAQGPVKCVYYRHGTTITPAECLSFEQLMFAIDASIEQLKIPQPASEVR